MAKVSKARAARILKICKLEAARRQLEAAIILWFNGGDPVAIHTLAFAAYEIVHTISKKRDPQRRKLLFDSSAIVDQHRSEFNIWIKSHANFFKHGNRDGEAVIYFQPALSELFILYAIFGLELCGQSRSTAQSAFVWWISIHKPHWLTQRTRNIVADRIPVDSLAELRQVDKADFLKAFRGASVRVRRLGVSTGSSD
jgi:hypothetical protein